MVDAIARVADDEHNYYTQSERDRKRKVRRDRFLCNYGINRVGGGQDILFTLLLHHPIHTHTQTQRKIIYP